MKNKKEKIYTDPYMKSYWNRVEYLANNNFFEDFKITAAAEVSGCNEFEEDVFLDWINNLTRHCSRDEIVSLSKFNEEDGSFKCHLKHKTKKDSLEQIESRILRPYNIKYIIDNL